MKHQSVKKIGFIARGLTVGGVTYYIEKIWRKAGEVE